MKRIFSSLAVLAAFALSAVPAGADHLSYDRLWIRHSNFGTAFTNNQNWAIPINDSPAFLDSSVFRRGVTTRTSIPDTTMGYEVWKWLLPPTYPNHLAGGYAKATARAGAGGASQAFQLTDSLVTDTLDATPWIVVRVRQDTTAYGFATSGAAGASQTTLLDSVYVMAQWSVDGKNWNSVGGTPTRKFDAVFLPTATGEDGVQVPALLVGEVGGATTADVCSIPLQCQPAIYAAGGALILNRTACMIGGYIRFIFAPGAGTGQFIAEVGNWKFDR